MRTALTALLIPGLALVLTLGPGPSLVRAADAEEEGAEQDLSHALAAFFNESDAEARMTQGMRIAATWPDAAQVARAVKTARVWSHQEIKGDVVAWTHTADNDVEHTILANVPPSYDWKKPTPVLLWLHGAVSRPQDGGGASGIRAFKALSDEEGFLLLSPSGRRGSEWWTPTGTALLRAALAELARRYNVDGNRVAVSGFSDGASGCFHLLAHDPEPYACFLPLMAHPGVTRLAGGRSFAANVGSRPVLAFNGGEDPLYPSDRVKPLIDELKAAGCDITWTDLPEAGHRMTDVMPGKWEQLRTFWAEHPRKSLRKRIAWESAVPAIDERCDWVEIVTVDPQAPSAKDMQEAVLADPAGRPMLGITLDRAYRGPGIKIETVTDDSAAADAGFRPGDLIVSVDGRSLETAQAFNVLREALDGLSDREGVFEVRRGEEELELSCQPRVQERTLASRPKGLGYGGPSGRIEAVVGGADGKSPGRIDVKTRHVGLFKLHLARGLVDLSKPVTVFVNGKQRFEGRPEGSAAYVLGEAVRAGPGAPAWQAVIALKP